MRGASKLLILTTIIILLGSLPQAVSMRSQKDPPTISDIKSLDTVNTHSPVVYVGGLKAREPGHHHQLYVGSVTGSGKGLNFWVHDQHENLGRRRKKQLICLS